MAGVEVIVTIASWQEAFGVAAQSGSLAWQLTNVAAADGVVIGRAKVPVSVSNGVGTSAALWANDSLEPAGTGWVLSGMVDGEKVGPFTYVLTSAMAPTVDLAHLTPSSPGQVYYPSVVTYVYVDGGAAATTYLPSQNVDGGNASGY